MSESGYFTIIAICVGVVSAIATKLIDWALHGEKYSLEKKQLKNNTEKSDIELLQLRMRHDDEQKGNTNERRQFDIPEPWYLVESNDDFYEIGKDSNIFRTGRASCFLRSLNGPGGFGVMVQKFSARDYRRRRVRLLGTIMSKDVSGWSGLWMRVDTASRISSAFDNMKERPIRGSTSWSDHEIVLDVDEDAVSISIGILLDGTGQIWIDGAEFEVVGDEVPTTDTSIKHYAPMNLKF